MQGLGAKGVGKVEIQGRAGKGRVGRRHDGSESEQTWCFGTRCGERVEMRVVEGSNKYMRCCCSVRPA
jgi:hypothetical protein